MAGDPRRRATGLAIGVLLTFAGTSVAWSRQATSAPQPTPPAKPAEAPARAGSTPGADSAKPDGADLSAEESLARFQQLLQRRPFHGPAFEGMVKQYVDRAKLQDLVAEYTAKSAALPDDVALKIVLARLHVRAGDATAAAKVLESIDKLPPDLARNQSDLLALKSEVYQRAGDNAGAERMLKQAQAQAPSTSEKLRLGEALADLYLRDGRRDDAVACLTALAKDFPDNYLHQRHIAGALAQRGLHEAAVERYKAVLELTKGEVDRRCEVLRELGQSLERLNKRDEAIAAYVEAVGLLASDHWLQKDLQDRIVNLYRASNKLEELAAYCQAQIKRSPDQTSMRVLLADVQSAMGKPDLGKQTFADAVALLPKDLALSQKRIEFLERLDDAAGVAAEYERIIGQHPGEDELYIAYGQSLAASKQIDAARNQWRRVLATKLDDAALAVRLGTLFETYDLDEDAAEAYERAITAKPAQSDAYAALARLWLARGDADKAVATLERMGTANPTDAGAQAALAQALRGMGKTAEALNAITRACDLAPDQVKYQQTRSDLLVQSGRLQEAIDARRTALDRTTNPLQQAEGIATLVSMAASAQKLPDLAAAEEARLKDRPGDTVSLLVLARIADTQRDFVALRARLDTLLKADPGNEIALEQLAKLYDATGDINGAVDTYTRLIQRTPARARQYYEAVVDLKLRYNDQTGATETLQSMAASDPTSAATQSAVAEQLVRIGDPQRALAFFERALQIQADRHETRLEYGKALVEAGRLEDGLGAFRAVATQRSDTDRAMEAIDRMHDTAQQLGRLEDLLDELQQQVETDPSNTLVARALAQLLVRELEYARAMDMLDAAQRNNPRDVDLALVRADVLRRLARFDEAADAYQRALRFPQIDQDYVLGELGKTWFEAGQVEQAKRQWRQIQNKLYSGTLLKNNGLLEDAAGTLEEGIRLKPDDYALHRNLITTYEAAGRVDDAMASARRLLDLDPTNVANIERLAAAFVRLGDRAGAAEIAARLFSAAVGPDKTPGAGQGQSPGSGPGYQSLQAAMYRSTAAQIGNPYGYGSYGSGQARTNMERGVAFFLENGLNAELDEVLTRQIAAQPDSAILKDTAARLYETELNKPELALSLLRELETTPFPVEHQSWLGQCSQRDWMRIRQFNLIAQRPDLRDGEVARIEARPDDQLGRDDLLELAIIRASQGSTDRAAELLERAVKADDADTLALGVLTDLLVGGEKFDRAEPFARRLVDVLAKRREQLHAETVERVRRDFVRSLPLEMQLRVTDELLADIADKWTMGSGWADWNGTSTRAVGYLRARLTLATICAETKRLDEARAIWQDLAPRRGPDVDRWTMLGDTVQVYEQRDLAFEFYKNALDAAKKLAGDPLLRQVYSSAGASSSWYGGDAGGVDKAFNSIVDSFAKNDRLLELYDFLRDSGQEAKARRLAEQYTLDARLKPVLEQRVRDAAAAFKAAGPDRLRASTAYFAQVCKLAEVVDRTDGWDKAQGVYEAYLADFPDELGLINLLSEVAEARLKLDEAVAWEKKVIDCKERLAKSARDWALRDLDLTPGRPTVLSSDRVDAWEWSSRWSRNPWSYGRTYGELDRSPSWMRLARLHLASNNPLAAADAMQQAVAEAGSRRDQVVREVIGLIQQRQLTAKMLPVLRTLAVYAPSDERVQLVFLESLKANGNTGVALEVADRMLRRGVSDLGVLAQVRRNIAELRPEAAAPEVTVATLEAEAAADKTNLKARLRLARAYYYDLKLDKARAVLAPLAEEAPHLEDIHDLLVEVYTLTGDTDKLIEALKAKIDRQTDERARRTARWRLVDELLGAGRTDEALALVKDLGDPRDPDSYTRIGVLLHYFGRHEEATAAFAQAKKSRSGSAGRYGGEEGDFSVATSLAMRGDLAGAAERILAEIDDQSRQQMQFSAMFMGEQNTTPFAPVEAVLTLHPELAADIGARLEARRQAAPTDPKAAKLLMGFYQSTGRPDKAEAIVDEMAAKGATDQGAVTALIDRAVRRREYAKAIELAQNFIAQTPKPQVPPGMPAQYAGYALIQSPRTAMVCKLGDIYWETGDKDKAFEAYRQIVDDKMEITRPAYAMICLLRGRTDEARKLIDEALAAQSIKPPQLLQFSAFLYAADGNAEKAFQALVDAAAPGGQAEDPYGRDGSPVQMLSTLALHAGLVDQFAAFARTRIEKDPNDFEPYSTLAQLYWSAGRPDDALKVLEEAAKIPQLSAQALQSVMSRRAPLAPPQELIPLYQKLIELAEANVGADADRSRYGGESESSSQAYRDDLGVILWNQGQQDEAKRIWTERLNTQRAQTHIRLARTYTQLYDFAQAEAAYDRALELEPDNAAAHNAAAALAFQRGDRRKTLRHMLEVFLSGARTEEQSSRYNPYAYAQARYGYTYSGDDEGGPAPGMPSRMTQWAAALVADPDLTTYLEDPAIAERADQARLMLASATGDWAGVESLLRPQIEAGTIDPVAWQMWAKVNQRTGNWTEVARALEFQRRARLTSIAEHRDKLKLVLAGKQLREAAAGTRQAQPGQPTPGGASGAGAYYGRSSRYYGGYYGYGSDTSGNSLLASIYLKLGDFTRAERLYLVSSGGDGVQGSLPSLASLMWDQDARDRALELSRFAILFSGGDIARYAEMLAQSGKLEPAVDLLVRAYCWNSEEAQNARYRMMYGGGDSSEFEQGTEQQVADTLSGILKRAGQFDQTVQSLVDRSAKEPGNLRLAKLVLSLQKRGERWAELRDGLARRRASGPPDAAMLAEEFHANCQLGRWDDALALIPEMRAQSPRTPDTWSRHEAFVHFMKGDADKAIAALQPVLAKDISPPNTPPRAETSALLAAGRIKDLAQRLQSRRAAAELDPVDTELLVRVLAADAQWDQALGVALEEFWNQPGALSTSSRWWRAVCTLAQSAAAQNAALAPRRPVDAALLALATEGPQAGLKRFTALNVKDQSLDLDAARGQIFAATLAGDDALALDATRTLVNWLAPRRTSAWRRDTTPGIDRVVRQGIEQMAEAGTAQAMAYGTSSMQSLGLDRMSRGSPVLTYQPLWQSHTDLLRSQLARAGKTDDLRDLARLQARASSSSSEDDSSYASYAYAGGFTSYSSPSYGRRSNVASENAGTDWARTLRRNLWSTGRLDLLLREYESLPSPPVGELAWYEECLAAAGKLDDAAAARKRRAAAMLADLRAADLPDLGASTQRSRWYWQSDDASARTVAAVRAALWAAPSDDPEDPDRSRGPSSPTSLAALALADPQIERALLACADAVGPGWLSTRTVQELITFHRARNQPQRVLELIERSAGTGGVDQILRSPRLEPYVWACWKTKSFDKLAGVLSASEKFGESVQRDVLLARLMLARASGDTDRAATLESDFLRRARPPRTSPLAASRSLVDGLSGTEGPTAQRTPDLDPLDPFTYAGASRTRRGAGASPGRQGSLLPDFARPADLAAVLDVRFDMPDSADDYAVGVLRQYYERHGLFADAARLLEQEAAQAPGDRFRADLALRRAVLLQRAGQRDAARAAALYLEQSLLKAIEAAPTLVEPRLTLVELYRSKAYGPDHDKALAALSAARLRNPACDRSGRLAVHSLHTLGRHKDAWEAWRGGERSAAASGGDFAGEPTMFYAGLSALQCGEADAGRALLRRAVFEFPSSPLAPKAREAMQ
jgi:tetratricopeptide (TPR) repeat protein